MHIIDHYAYTNRIRHLDPAQKATLAIVVVGLCLLLDHPAVGITAVVWMGILSVGWAGTPGRVVGRVLLAEAMFLVLAVVGVALSFSLAPPPPLPWQGIQMGPLWVGTCPESLALAGLLVSRALGCAAAMNFLALTTPLVDIVELLRRVRVPLLLIDLASLMYRFIFVLLESLQRMYTAQESRLGYANRRATTRSSGLLASRLFIDAYQRSIQLQTALESRGYTGELRVLPSTYRQDTHVYWLTAAVASSLLFIWGMWGVL
jgi:cobalt/nickel transport system permease protein